MWGWGSEEDTGNHVLAVGTTGMEAEAVMCGWRLERGCGEDEKVGRGWT